jgi:RHO1 GDP-GTP exchange protein 1/2
MDYTGKPARTYYHIEWERRASAYARPSGGPHLLLLSSIYIEVRNIETCKLVQIVEVNDVRLLRSSLTEPGMLIAAMIGGTEDDGGRTEKLAEVVYQGT